jgi:hypothetical protein
MLIPPVPATPQDLLREAKVLQFTAGLFESLARVRETQASLGRKIQSLREEEASLLERLERPEVLVETPSPQGEEFHEDPQGVLQAGTQAQKVSSVDPGTVRFTPDEEKALKGYGPLTRSVFRWIKASGKEAITVLEVKTQWCPKFHPMWKKGAKGHESARKCVENAILALHSRHLLRRLPGPQGRYEVVKP